MEDSTTGFWGVFGGSGGVTVIAFVDALAVVWASETVICLIGFAVACALVGATSTATTCSVGAA